MTRGRRVWLLASFCAPPTAAPPTMAPSAPLTIRPRTDPFASDDGRFSEADGLPEEAERPLDDEAPRAPPEAALLRVPPDAALLRVPPDDALLRVPPEEALLGVPPDEERPEDADFEVEPFAAERFDPEEDRVRLLPPLVVAISVHPFRSFAELLPPAL